MKTVLVTGAHGFLGRNTALYFKGMGYQVTGVGLGSWEEDESHEYGIDVWYEADVNLNSMCSLGTEFDVIVHCAGGSSVKDSFDKPYEDFAMTVNTTSSVLEYMRICNNRARLVYPSSAAVYGEKGPRDIREDDEVRPISPYGCHKRMAEQLCKAYSNFYGLHIAVIRFFSIYGKGLRKQLLWDACKKLVGGGNEARFSGTGEEVRDWIHVTDAVALIYTLAQSETPFDIYNGAGHRASVREILNLMAALLEGDKGLIFDGSEKRGDPKRYTADMTKTYCLGWNPEKDIRDGVKEYIGWFKEEER